MPATDANPESARAVWIAIERPPPETEPAPADAVLTVHYSGERISLRRFIVIIPAALHASTASITASSRTSIRSALLIKSQPSTVFTSAEVRICLRLLRPTRLRNWKRVSTYSGGAGGGGA